MLSVLVLAAAVAAAPPPVKAPDSTVARPPAPILEIRLYTDRPSTIGPCDGAGLIQTAKVQSPDPLRLGALPKANLERTVMVTQGGCVKPQVIY